MAEWLHVDMIMGVGERLCGPTLSSEAMRPLLALYPEIGIERVEDVLACAELYIELRERDKLPPIKLSLCSIIAGCIFGVSDWADYRLFDRVMGLISEDTNSLYEGFRFVDFLEYILRAKDIENAQLSYIQAYDEEGLIHLAVRGLVISKAGYYQRLEFGAFDFVNHYIKSLKNNSARNQNLAGNAQSIGYQKVHAARLVYPKNPTLRPSSHTFPIGQ